MYDPATVSAVLGEKSRHHVDSRTAASRYAALQAAKPASDTGRNQLHQLPAVVASAVVVLGSLAFTVVELAPRLRF